MKVVIRFLCRTGRYLLTHRQDRWEGRLDSNVYDNFAVAVAGCL